MVKVFKLVGYLGGTISIPEAIAEKINVSALKLASINDCISQIKNGDVSCGYAGKIKLIEGVYEFDFASGEYNKVKIKGVKLFLKDLSRYKKKTLYWGVI